MKRDAAEFVIFAAGILFGAVLMWLLLSPSLGAG